MSGKGFTMIPNWFIDAFLSDFRGSSTALVYLVLARFSNANRESWPSQETIARKCGISDRSVRKALKQLEANELLQCCNRGKSTSVYRLIDQIDSNRNSDSTYAESQPEPEFLVTGTEVPPNRNCSSALTGTPVPTEQDTRTIPIKKTQEQETSEKKPSRFSVEDKELAEYLFEKVKQVAPKTKTPNLDQWAETIRLMRERDEMNLSEIKNVFDWANGDSFWSLNILSPSKLRTQFATLHAKMINAEKDKRNGNKFNSGQTYDPATAGKDHGF